jgi:hypothetical protein
VVSESRYVIHKDPVRANTFSRKQIFIQLELSLASSSLLLEISLLVKCIRFGCI